MKVSTSRFGQVEIAVKDFLTLPEGLLGFTELSTFVILDDPSNDIFIWLQSCEDPSIAFPILESRLCTNIDYRTKMARHDLASLGVTSESELDCYVLITIPEDITKMTANLRAPIILNKNSRIARQCVLQEESLNICEPVFASLKQCLTEGSKGDLGKGSTQDSTKKSEESPVDGRGRLSLHPSQE